MTDLVRIGPVAYPSLTAAIGALQNTAQPQLIEVLGPIMGADAFGTVNPGDQAIVTISGVVQPDGSLPELKALGTFARLAWGKAIINAESVKSLTIQNLLMTNAACSDANGAAVRGNAACQALYLKNVIARNNEDGILSNDSAFISIEDSLFDANGQSSVESRKGYSHNAYVAGKRIEVRRSTFKNSAFGHDFKSRMWETYLYESYFGGSAHGRALDLSNGGTLYAENCVFEKFDGAEQNNLCDIAPESVPDARPQSYRFVNCRFANGIAELAREIQFVLNRTDFDLELVDCELAGPATPPAKAFSSVCPGKVTVTLTSGPLGPVKPVGRAADAVAAPAPVVPVQPDPAPNVPAYGTWERAGVEGDTFNSPANTLVRYGIAPNWVQKTVSGAWSATNEFFGSDPAVGVKKEVQLYFPPVDGKPVGADITPVTTTPAPAPAPAPAAPPADASAFMAAMVAGFSAFLDAAGYTVTKK
jgi:hypothetical protein